MNFDRMDVKLNLRSTKTEELFTAKFSPIYFSVSDEWVEDYSRVGKTESPLQLMDFISDIEEKFPGEGKHFQNAKLYFANVMEWSIRFVSYKIPMVALSHEKDLPNAF